MVLGSILKCPLSGPARGALAQRSLSSSSHVLDVNQGLWLKGLEKPLSGSLQSFITSIISFHLHNKLVGFQQMNQVWC